jgi:hypothetical protein
MNRDIPGEVAMRFQVRDLMFSVFPVKMAQESPEIITTQEHGCDCNDKKICNASCQGQSGCPVPSQAPKMAREMLSVLRDRMRQALLPA